LTALLTIFDILFPAITYLNNKGKLHRDISYTNILLRDPGNNSVVDATRRSYMEGLGLSDIEKLRKELKCREGLLIDFDYGAPDDGVVAVEDIDGVAVENVESVDEFQLVQGGVNQPASQSSREETGNVNQASQSTGEGAQEFNVAPAFTRGLEKPSGARTVCFFHL
jgi:serine/threonine protein kinase